MWIRFAAYLSLLLVGLIGPVRLCSAAEDEAANDSQTEAQNKGQGDLDKAVEAKLAAENPSELGEVIAYCQQALDKGLDAANTEFAKKLLASTLFERGKLAAEAIFSPPQPDPRWPQLREMALTDLERAVKHVPDQPEALLLIGKLNSLPGGDKARALKALETAGRMAGSEDDLATRYNALMLHAELDESLPHRLKDLDEAIKLKPEDPLPLRIRGRLKLSADKGDEAIADFDAAIKLDPKNATTYEMRGLALAMLKRLDEARESFGKAVELAPQSTPLLLQRAQISYLDEKFENAVEDATQVLKIDPDNIAALLLRASLARTKHTDEALEDADAVLKQRPDLLPALRTRAMIFAAAGKTDEAIADLTKISDEEPRDLEIRFQLAMLQRTKKNFTKAIEILNRALAIDPQSWFLHYGRGDLYLGQGKHVEAIADYEIAVKQQPKDASILNNFAWVLSTSPDDNVRDASRAIELAKIACEVTEYKQAHILSTLAASYADAGDFETAVKWSKKAIEVTKDDDARESLKKELASYEGKHAWREQLHEDLSSDKADDKASAETEPDSASPNATQGAAKPRQTR